MITLPLPPTTKTKNKNSSHFWGFYNLPSYCYLKRYNFKKFIFQNNMAKRSLLRARQAQPLIDAKSYIGKSDRDGFEVKHIDKYIGE